MLDEDNADALREAVENLEEDEQEMKDGGAMGGKKVDASSSLAALNNFQLSGQGAPGTGMDGDDSDTRLEWTCWCALHKPNVKNRPKLIIIEFELENDIMNPIMQDRTAEEIAEDKAREQSESIFGERPASGPDGPPTSIPGLGGAADGETPDPGAAASSLPGMLGQGGNNGSSTAAATSSGVEGSNAPENDVSGGPVTPGEEGLGGAATQEEIDSSTRSRVKPIRALRRLRKAKGGPGGGDVMKLFSVLGQINDELSKAEELQTSLEIAAGVVAEITGFHRVMIYQVNCFTCAIAGKLAKKDAMVTYSLMKGGMAKLLPSLSTTSRHAISIEACTSQHPTYQRRHANFTKSTRSACYTIEINRPLGSSAEA